MPETLSIRALNRAYLARQLLLERAEMAVLSGWAMTGSGKAGHRQTASLAFQFRDS
jgi:hypothetical protein